MAKAIKVNEKGYALGLFVQDKVEARWSSTSTTLEITVYPMLYMIGDPEAETRSVMDSWENPEEWRAYEDLTLHFYVWSDERPARWSVDLRYAHVGFVDSRRAQAMAKCITRLEKALQRINEREGYPDSIGEYIARFGRVLEVNCFIRNHPKADEPSRWGQRRPFKFEDAASMRWFVKSKLYDFEELHCPPTQKREEESTV